MKKIFMFLMTGAVLFSACDDDDDNGKKDPEGTLTLNVTRTNPCNMLIQTKESSAYVPETVDGYFYWDSPDDILIGDSWYMNNKETLVDGYWYRFYCEADICSVGKVSGLGAVKKVPSGTWVAKLACEEESGYVVRVRYKTSYKYLDGVDGSSVDVNPGDPDYFEGVVYARFYVEDHLENANDENTGMKIKIQYPFKP